MKNVLLLSGYFLISFLPLIAFAQKSHLTLGAELARRGGGSGMNINGKKGYGGSIGIETILGGRVTGIVTVSHLRLEKSQPFYGEGTTIQESATLVQAGIKYYVRELVTTPKGLFLSAEIGVMPTTTHFDYLLYPDWTYRESGLSAALGVGYFFKRFELNLKPQFNLSASGFNTYYYSLRLGYAFLRFGKKE